MPISQADQLFLLIKSLTKSEKRNFRLYATRNQESSDMIFIQLFDLLDKQVELDEDALLKKMGGLNKTSFSNAKRHLYTQIMNSLRLLHTPKVPEIKVREYLDFADVLYGKGLYLQSLKILGKARMLADKIHNDLLYLSIIEFEKIIESRHITRSGVNKSSELVGEADRISKQVSNAIVLSNLRVLLHARYIKYGHVKDEAEKVQVQQYFQENMPAQPYELLNVPEQVYLFQSYVWYYYILLDFENCLEFARRWVSIFKEQEEMIQQDPDLFMRGYHYLLTCLYNLKRKDEFQHYLDEFEMFRDSSYHMFNYNSQIISFLYVHTARLNRHFLSGTFEGGLQEIPRSIRRIKRYTSRLDAHRIMVFYYKFSWMYLAAGKPDKAVEYLNKIIQMDVENLREDIQGYARLMFLMAHYDLENYHLMDYLVNSVKSFFEKHQGINKLQAAVMVFFESVSKAPFDERKKIMKDFYTDLEVIAEDPFERRAFIYLEIQFWILAKLSRLSVSEVVQHYNKGGH